MLTKILEFNPLATASFNKFSEPGTYDGLLYTWTGANNAGQVGVVSDLGETSVKRNNVETHNRPFKVFTDMGDIRSGTNVYVSVDGSTFEASAFVPFFERGIPSALQISGDRELNVKVTTNSATIATVFSALTCTVEARRSYLSELYTFFVLGNDLDYSGVVTNKPEQLPGSNITTVYIDDSGSEILSSLQAKQDDQLVIGQTSKLSLKAQTIISNSIEDSTFTTLQLMMFSPGRILSVMSNNTTLGITTSGVGSILVTVCSMIPNERMLQLINQAA